MRTFLLRSILVLGILVVLLVTAGTVLTIFGPLHPGSFLFPLQSFAEQRYGMIYRDPVAKADYLLNLVDRRVNDLVIRSGTGYEYTSLKYLDEAINQAALAISSVPQAQGEGLKIRFITLARQAQQALGQLKRAPIEEPAAFNAFMAKVQTIQHMVGSIKVQNNELVLVPAIAGGSATGSAGVPNAISFASGLIPWPAGSQGAVHAFYPLTGAHATLQCVSCHDAGVYFGTPNQCVECHLAKAPAVHYPGDCGLCHSSTSWKDVHFDHITVAVMACVDCHYKDRPANHYNGPCSACHITQNWTTVTFDHSAAGAVDCISCHSQKEPANHYAGQCSNCHNTSNWTSVVFDHTGFTDCRSCHAQKAPANHYNGQCSNCHNTSNWTSVVFDHAGFTDCISCHANKAPAGHYAGQCSNCHNTSNWTSVRFNHSGFTDCIACHANKAPAGHYPGQCSNCHNTSNWTSVVFDHTGFTDCQACHLKDRPAEHDPGQCSDCHNTSSWAPINNPANLGTIIYGRAELINCSACHATSALAYEGTVRQ